jgi:hypothetical protein
LRYPIDSDLIGVGSDISYQGEKYEYKYISQNASTLLSKVKKRVNS